MEPNWTQVNSSTQLITGELNSWLTQVNSIPPNSQLNSILSNWTQLLNHLNSSQLYSTELNSMELIELKLINFNYSQLSSTQPNTTQLNSVISILLT